MQKTYTILRSLKTLLENKETYNKEDYGRKLLALKKEIDQHLLSENNNPPTEEEQELLLQHYKALIKTI